MSNISKLRECTSLAEADQILNQSRAGVGIRRLVETGIMLKNNSDKVQRELGYSFINDAIRELEPDEQPNTASGMGHDNGIKKKGDHFVKEEEVSGIGTGNAGSEQSSDNTEPYPQVADKSGAGDKPAEGLEDTDDQMKEGFGGNGMYPQQGGMPPMGLEPSIANEMGQGMPQMPPMNPQQMMKQMQYTMERYHRNIILPMRKQFAQAQEAIQVLSRQVRESESRAGTMKLDVDSIKKGATARPHIQETSGIINTGMTYVQQGNPNTGDLQKARTDILALDKVLSLNKSNQPYQ